MGLEVIQTIGRACGGLASQAAAAAGVLVVATCAEFALGQQAPASPPLSPPSPPPVVPGTEEAKRTAPPLLREGSFIARARGRFAEDKARREWTFTPEAVDRSGLVRTLVLLPNEVLGDAVRVARLAPNELEFELTGEVFLYRGRNYVLPALLTPLAPLEPPAQVSTAPPPTSTSASGTSSPAAPALPQDEEAIARELERRLAERLDRMPKPPAPQPSENAGERPADPLDGRRSEVRSDTPIQSRRGQLVRDNATGGWRFVFEGQLADGGEPSMPVLPCLALERIENSVRQSDGTLSLTVTGTTTLFEGRSYLLPSVFRVARGGRGIGP
jgi:hypothetical protein